MSEQDYFKKALESLVMHEFQRSMKNRLPDMRLRGIIIPTTLLPVILDFCRDVF